MIGVVVTGTTASGVEDTTRGFRRALERLFG
jgi:hypothetical protein